MIEFNTLYIFRPLKVAFREKLQVSSESAPEDRTITLRFRRFIFDPDKKKKPVQ